MSQEISSTPVEPAPQALGSSTNYPRAKGGRPKAWWTEEYFTSTTVTATNSSNAVQCLTCKTCQWSTKAKVPNTSQLGRHLLRCRRISPSTRKRLLENERLAKYYNEHLRKGSSELFGVPMTPSKRRRRRSTPQSKSSGEILMSGSGAFADSRDSNQADSDDSYTKRTKFNELLTKLFVTKMLPFSLLSREPGQDLLYQLIRVANADIAEQIPTAKRMETKNLDLYHKSVFDRVKESITSALSATFATLVFDGWTDVNGEGVVNVLLSLTGVERVRRTFFLKSVYTGSESCDAASYCRVMTEVFSEFGSMKRVCAVVSDNTSSCVKAKNSLADAHNHVLPIQDQTHLANLLMQDFGKLPWVGEILDMVSTVVSEVRNHSKLYHRLKEFKALYNKELVTETTSNTYDKYGRVSLPGAVILPQRMAPTRFASSESMLSSFLRSKVVLRKVIECSDFKENLFGRRHNERRGVFEDTVKDDSLHESALDIYHILRLVRQYLRLFDDETSLISEVYPATMQLRRKLQLLPLTPFYTSARKDQILQVFDHRLNGVGRKIPLVTTIHQVAFLLDLRSLSQEMQGHNEAIATQIGLFVRSDSFPRSKKMESDGGVDGAIDRLCQEFVNQRMSWKSQAFDPVSRRVLMMYSSTPVFYWSEVAEKTLLRQFALHILCASPSSASVERSFSLQGRIRTPTRNRLHQSKVSKLIFCAFNESLLRSRSKATEMSNRKAYMDLRLGWVRDAVPGVGSEVMGSGEAYSKFLDDEEISDWHLSAPDAEDDDMELLNLEDETQLMTTAEAAEAI